jgi:methionine--tRNA ligase beta chain
MIYLSLSYRFRNAVSWMITISEFQKVEMKIGKVLSAEPIRGSDKLFKLVVDAGAEQRQIVSGIADTYTPGELVGKSIVIVANLEPKRLRGVESQGMLLAADGERPILLLPERDVPPGTPVR